MGDERMEYYGQKMLFCSAVAALCLCICAQKDSISSEWKTLSGKEPIVVARGGLSGLFPDYTRPAYQVAINNSFNAVMFCNLQLTKDGQGICRTDIRLNNSTKIKFVYENRSTSYIVNGYNISGWFSIDFTAEELKNVSAMQSVQTRSTAFDDIYPLVLPEDIPEFGPAQIWLNVQNSKFFEEHNLSASSYVRSLSRRMSLHYISSTEIGFLRAITPEFKRSKTKLILKFREKEDFDPSVNQTYSSILKNLTSVREVAAEILVAKTFIWPLGEDLYLQAPTNLVNNAHSAGLEIFAADFANDKYGMSYNYSYDPVREYLQFVDNNNFTVDGLLTDFSVTATDAIACYAHNKVNMSSRTGNPLIISYNGASGDYPGCTDIAYQAAIRDGADYIDCTVQITKDGIPFCRESPDLLVGTTITSNSIFYPSRKKKIPVIQNNDGIFTFDLTWEEVQSLIPNTFSPFGRNYYLLRNPALANVGKYMSLSSFLDFAKRQANISVLINIENARAIASERKLDVTNATICAIDMAGHSSISDRIRIESDDSAVLVQFKEKTKFKLVYRVEESNITIPDFVIKEIKEFADTVVLTRSVVFPTSNLEFLLNTTDVVRRMHLHNITVFIYTLRNEYPSLAFDYLSNPTMEINSFVQVAKVDGLITAFPATARAYLGNTCLHPRTENDPSMFLVIPGSVLQALPLGILGPALAPAPSLSGAINPPLPSVGATPSPSPAASKSSSAFHTIQFLFSCFTKGLLALLLLLLFNGY